MMENQDVEKLRFRAWAAVPKVPEVPSEKVDDLAASFKEDAVLYKGVYEREAIIATFNNNLGESIAVANKKLGIFPWVVDFRTDRGVSDKAVLSSKKSDEEVVDVAAKRLAQITLNSRRALDHVVYTHNTPKVEKVESNDPLLEANVTEYGFGEKWYPDDENSIVGESDMVFYEACIPAPDFLVSERDAILDSAIIAEDGSVISAGYDCEEEQGTMVQAVRRSDWVWELTGLAGDAQGYKNELSRDLSTRSVALELANMLAMSKVGVERLLEYVSSCSLTHEDVDLIETKDRVLYERPADVSGLSSVENLTVS